MGLKFAGRCWVESERPCQPPGLEATNSITRPEGRTSFRRSGRFGETPGKLIQARPRDRHPRVPERPGATLENPTVAAAHGTVQSHPGGRVVSVYHINISTATRT